LLVDAVKSLSPQQVSAHVSAHLQGNPVDEEAPGSEEFDMEEVEPEPESPPAAKAKQKLKTVLKTLQVRLLTAQQVLGRRPAHGGAEADLI
jgi:hypothetical protein